MKFLIFTFALVWAVSAVPPPTYYHPQTLITTHAKTYYAPLVQTNYGSHVNHLVPVPEPIYKPVPQPYPVPVPQPYDVPRPVPVAVPRPVPVEVPRPVPVPLVAQAAPIITKSVVHAAPVVEHHGPALLEHHGAPGPYHHGGPLLDHGPVPYAEPHGPALGHHGPALPTYGHYKK